MLCPMELLCATGSVKSRIHFACNLRTAMSQLPLVFLPLDCGASLFKAPPVCWLHLCVCLLGLSMMIMKSKLVITSNVCYRLHLYWYNINIYIYIYICIIYIHIIHIYIYNYYMYIYIYIICIYMIYIYIWYIYMYHDISLSLYIYISWYIYVRQVPDTLSLQTHRILWTSRRLKILFRFIFGVLGDLILYWKSWKPNPHRLASATRSFVEVGKKAMSPAPWLWRIMQNCWKTAIMWCPWWRAHQHLFHLDLGHRTSEISFRQRIREKECLARRQETTDAGLLPRWPTTPYFWGNFHPDKLGKMKPIGLRGMWGRWGVRSCRIPTTMCLGDRRPGARWSVGPLGWKLSKLSKLQRKNT